MPFKYEFDYLLKLKLKVFERWYLPKLRKFSPIGLFWPFLKRRIIKNSFYIQDDLRADGMPTTDFHMFYAVSYGWITLFLVVTLSLFSAWLLYIFPLEVTDALWALIDFLWTFPFISLMFVSFVGIFILLLTPESKPLELKSTSLGISYTLSVLIILIMFRFDYSSEDLQFAYRLSLDFFDYIANFMFMETSVRNYNFATEYFNVHIAGDGVSLLLTSLTIFLFLLCDLLNGFSTKRFLKEFLILFHTLQLFCFFAFLSFDLIVFYVFFEAVLIPMFLIIGLGGNRDRKIYAANKLFFYTLFCSLFTLVGIVLLVSATTSTDIEFLSTISFTRPLEFTIFLLFFMSFAVKLPMIPFHPWLPEAHVEAPTTGSIILAGVLLKLGGYGFLRFLIPLFPVAFQFFSPLIALLSCVGIVFGSIVAIRQIDLKKVIAYSSIAHMALAILGFAVPHTLSLNGGFFILLSHGFVSSALFLAIGVLYDRYKTKLIFYYTGLASVMPIFSIFLFLFIMANIALPGTSAFIGEFFTISGVIDSSFFLATLGATGIVFGVSYSLWLFNRIIFGRLQTTYIRFYQDINLEEFMLLTVLLLPTILFGFCPTYLFDIFSYDMEDLSATVFYEFLPYLR